MKGYKYIAWDTDDYNAKIYLNKTKNNQILHYSELKIAKGYYDNDVVNGIHFCESQKDLIQWVKDCFEWENPACIEILEVIPIGKIKIRQYVQGRKAYITESCYVRLLNDEQIEQELFNVIVEYFS